jgi:branched-chain amino acid transport system permease protein
MEVFLQSLISGISLGSIYGLIGMGFTLVFFVSHIINLSQGQYFVFGALLYIVLSTFMPSILAAVLAVILSGILGLVMERLFIRPVSKLPMINQIVMTLAILITLEGVTLLVFGKKSMTAEPFWNGSIKLGNINILYQVIIVLAVVIIISLILNYFLMKTSFGRAFRACAYHPLSARLSGIQVRRMQMFAYGISGSLGAISGIIVSPLLLTNYTLGPIMVINGLIAAILGGLGAPMGALIGGLVLGLFESFASGLISSAYKDVMVLSFLLILLIFRPKGIFRGYN